MELLIDMVHYSQKICTYYQVMLIFIYVLTILLKEKYSAIAAEFYFTFPVLVYNFK